MARTNAMVMRVIDGDTFDIDPEINGSTRVRIADIDTPEKGMRGAGDARSHLEKMILGRTVTLDIKAMDVYHRLIAHVYKDGKSIGKRLKKRGY